jgi:hypothetical protein
MSAASVAIKEAMDALHESLIRGGSLRTEHGGTTFPSVRAHGSKGTLFISAMRTEKGEVLFLAPAEDADYMDPCSVIGTSTQVHQVAGIVRRRLAPVPPKTS